MTTKETSNIWIIELLRCWITNVKPPRHWTSSCLREKLEKRYFVYVENTSRDSIQLLLYSKLEWGILLYLECVSCDLRCNLKPLIGLKHVLNFCVSKKIYKQHHHHLLSRWLELIYSGSKKNRKNKHFANGLNYSVLLKIQAKVHILQSF